MMAPLRFLTSFLLLSLIARAVPVAPPTLNPDGGSAAAPLKVTLRSATPGATIHVTLDGTDPTERDTEIDSGSTIILDEPLTLKARARLSDGSTSPVKTARFQLTPVSGFGASFSDQIVSSSMAAGRRHKVSITLRNIGTSAWVPGSVHLTPRRAKDVALWNVESVPLAERTETWGSATFRFHITAPEQSGTYNFQWQLHAGSGGPVGEATALVRIQVIPLAHATKTNIGSAKDGDGKTNGNPTTGARSDRRARPLPEAVAKLVAANQVAPGSPIERVVRAIANSPHSFKALRERGLTQTDAEFEKLIAENPRLFRSVRIVRRNEQGERLIPGWPGIDLQIKRR